MCSAGAGKKEAFCCSFHTGKLTAHCFRFLERSQRVSGAGCLCGVGKKPVSEDFQSCAPASFFPAKYTLCIPVIPVLRRQRQEDGKFKASLATS